MEIQQNSSFPPSQLSFILLKKIIQILFGYNCKYKVKNDLLGLVKYY